MPNFSQSELSRYDRHLLIPEIGEEGQLRLKAARVLIVGAGGLGAPVVQYLAAAGVGTIGIADFDRVDLLNLQRQVIFSSADVGQAKSTAAARFAGNLNPEIVIREHNSELNSGNIREVMSEYDIAIDGSDNFETRYVVSDACVLLNKPSVQGAVHRFEGQVSVLVPGLGPCYRCIFPNEPAPGTIQNCAEAGVLGALPGIVGSIMATECLKLILAIGDSLTGQLLLVDALSMQFQKISIERNSNCTACGDSPEVSQQKRSNSDSIALSTCIETAIGANELYSELASADEPLVLLDVRESPEYEHSHLESAIHIPVNELSMRLSELPNDVKVVVYCKSGVRSRKAAKLLRDRGFMHVRNLAGGLLAWANDVDTSMSVHR